MTWVCDNCYGTKKVTRVGPNKRRVCYPKCETECFIDNGDEIIND